MSDTTFTDGVTLTAASWFQDVNNATYRNGINVKTSPYNATGNGTTDDTAAIQAAHDALGVNGGYLYFPPGVYLVSSLTISKQCLLVGSGRTTGGTEILAKNANSNVFNITGSGITVRDMCFMPNQTQTGGSYILCNSASSIVNVENVMMSGWFVGFQMNGISDFYLRNIRLQNGVPSTGIGVSVTSGLVVSMDRVVVTNALGSEPQAGMYVTNCGDITMMNCSFFHNLNGMSLIPGAGQVVTSVYCVNCFFDNNANRGVLIAPSSTTGTVQRCRFLACWFSSSGTLQGILMDTNAVAGTINGISFIDPKCYLNNTSGIHIAGANTSGIKIIGGACAQNGANGITIASGADNIQIIGVTCGPEGGLTGNTTYGISTATGVTDDLIIQDCQLTGNGTAAVQLGATGARRVALNNNGFVTQASGTGTITSGNTAAVITHGLAVTPSAQDISLNFGATSTNDFGNFWVDTIGSTVFSANCRSNPGTSGVSVLWSIDASTRI